MPLIGVAAVGWGITPPDPAMRLFLLAFVLLLTACADDDIPMPAPAADPAPGPIEDTTAVTVEPDTSVTAFFAHFQAAVREGQGDVVESMIDFPVPGLGDEGAARDVFLYTYYPSLFTEGDFRDRLLAASPRALEPDGEGGYTFQALVTSDCGDEGEPMDCESAAIYTFRRNAEGYWRIADINLAG